MNKLVVFAVALLAGCDNDYCKDVKIALQEPLTLKVFLGEVKKLDDGFVLSGLNKYWGAVGVEATQTKYYSDADFSVTYVAGKCQYPIFLKDEEATDLEVDVDCFFKAGYKTMFPAAVSHALGLFLGVESYHQAFGDGIMSRAVGDMTATIAPTAISQEDRNVFFNRKKAKYIKTSQEVETCRSAWDCGTYAPKTQKEIGVWYDESFGDMAVVEYLNDFYAVFGYSFKRVEKTAAKFTMVDWPKAYSCPKNQILGMAYSPAKKIYIKTSCVKKKGAMIKAAILAHEVGHLFGMGAHIPVWYDTGVMNPTITPAVNYCFSPADVYFWENRSGSVID